MILPPGLIALMGFTIFLVAVLGIVIALVLYFGYIKGHRFIITDKQNESSNKEDLNESILPKSPSLPKNQEPAEPEQNQV